MISRRLAAATMIWLAATSARTQPAAIRIAAASDLKFALDEIAAQYRQVSGQTLDIVYGSSGNFRRQIAQGAPFDLFLSADEGYVLALADAGLTRDRGTVYAQGRLALFAPAGGAFRPDEDWTDFRRALAAGAISRFAIANPEHAPYGRAAEQALRHAGLWDRIRTALVLGENVSQAARFATSGSAEGGLVALSLAMTPALRAAGDFALVPEGWHAPLIQRMVLLARASTAAADFYAYCQSVDARATFRRHGFAHPGER